MPVEATTCTLARLLQSGQVTAKLKLNRSEPAGQESPARKSEWQVAYALSTVSRPLLPYCHRTAYSY